MNPSANLFLIGPMGAGKTTLGKKLAEHYGLQFIDLDDEIERRCGVSVATVFEIEGEPGFRQRESKCLAEMCQLRGIVLATGGGSVLLPENRAMLSAHGFVLYLPVTVDQQLSRLARDRKRPLLQAPDRRERLTAMATVRTPLYEATADLRLDADSNQIIKVMETAVQQLDARWQILGQAA
ncbi:shikimate kinase [Ahniella affigens]|uniref:Shikimate kinase n=1 Tax=Ahniella affigens TaxID=2021234 RepID=A0A2P1PRM6_9GAMM|nr:shikimate kinase [Ahniella affigens]AVP97484.1 shikimate kinase [Ahniella affigens]